jgi:hypothetical protein
LKQHFEHSNTFSVWMNSSRHIVWLLTHIYDDQSLIMWFGSVACMKQLYICIYMFISSMTLNDIYNVLYVYYYIM